MSLLSYISTESITKTIGAITASFAMIGGGYTLYDKFADKSILTWHPEYFSVSSGPVTDKFNVIVAREKHRDDCTVEQFKIDIKDSKFHLHPVVPSISTSAGPATNKVEKFGFDFSIPVEHQSRINKGSARLLAHIVYKCPEGQVVVAYPDSDNLNFQIQ